MKYSDFGLVNTHDMLADALANHYAVPAFNFYNMETLSAILSAARKTHSPVILAASESAIEYMGIDMLLGLITGACISPKDQIALHLDHGHSLESCIYAIENGVSSVMIDASNMPFEENLGLSREVAKYAHRHNVSVEAELGILAGIEDKKTKSDKSSYTNPNDVVDFVRRTGVDSLAIAICTSHGAHKCKSDNETLRFDILNQIAKLLPDFPLVLHGASSIPDEYVKTINHNGGKVRDAHGINREQLRRAARTNICKINIDSDLRLGFTAGVRESLKQNPSEFNPREYLSSAIKNMTATCIDEISHIMFSKNRI